MQAQQVIDTAKALHGLSNAMFGEDASRTAKASWFVVGIAAGITAIYIYAKVKSKIGVQS